MSKTPISIRLQKILQEGHLLEFYNETEEFPSCWVIRTQPGVSLADGATLDECIGNYFKQQKSKRKHQGTAQEVAQ